MYDDNRYIIITIVHLHLHTHNMSLQFNGNDAVVIYLKSKWIEINLLCDVTLLTANFSLKYDIYFEEETISIFRIIYFYEYLDNTLYRLFYVSDSD